MLAAFLVGNLLLGQETNNVDLYSTYGQSFSPQSSFNGKEMFNEYKNLKEGDSLQVVFKAKSKEVCQAKGCWMKLQLDNENQVLVKFKDYGFFVPTDLKDEDVIVNGKAFVEEVSVEEQRHYARDAGKKESEIAKITEPKRTFRFEAIGVMVQE